MPGRRTAGQNWRLVAAALVFAAASAFVVPASAQFWERYPRRQQAPQRDYFPFSFFGGGSGHGGYYPFGQPQRPAESTKPPAPRKVDTPPASTVLVIGDSLADWLGYGLEETFAETPEIGFVRKIRPSSGLVRYEGKSDTPEWSQAVKDVLGNEKPSAIVVMLGVNDRLSLRAPAPAKPGAPQQAQQAGQTPQTPGQEQTPAEPSASDQQPPTAANEAQRASASAGSNVSYEFHTDKWAELYAKRIDDMIAALKTKGVPILWVGLPAVRGTRATSDMSYLDELYRARAEKAGITYVDVWDGFVDEAGRYTQQGPDFEGQIRRLRTYDGVHFTKAGAEKLAHYVDHDLRRVLSNRLLPVALPAPDEQSPAKGGTGARPAIGPAVPLNASLGAEGGDLIGAGSYSPPAKADPVAARVFSRGEAVAAPAGRADNFAWPRAEAATSAAVDVEPVPPAPVAAAPAAPAPAKGSAGKKPPEAKTEAKIDARSQPPPVAGSNTAPHIAPSAPAPHHRPRAEYDGAPRPPLPVGR